MNRGGTVRYAQKFIEAEFAKPLPEDMRERAVEKTRRSTLRAAYKDMRSPYNKRRWSEAEAAWERTLVSHMKTVHGIEYRVERDFYGTTFTTTDGLAIMFRKIEERHEQLHEVPA